MFKRILVAVDGSEPAGWALEVATSLARAQCPRTARVSLVHVVDATEAPCDLSWAPSAGAVLRDDLPRLLRRAGRQVLRQASATVPEEFLDKQLLREGHAADEILAAAREWNADVIVMGTHGRGRLTPLLLGATADTTARQAFCPVMVVARRPRQPRTYIAETEGAAASNVV